MAQLCECYMREYIRVYTKPETHRASERNVRLYILPQFGPLRVAAVTRVDVLKFHTAMRETPIAANHVLGSLSKMFNLAEEWGWRALRTNPVWRIPRYPARTRDRYLTRDEVQRLGAVLREVERTQTASPVVIAVIRLLMLTGCRREEILQLRWDAVDLAQRCLRLADSKTGAKVVHLNAPAYPMYASTIFATASPVLGCRWGCHCRWWENCSGMQTRRRRNATRISITIRCVMRWSTLAQRLRRRWGVSTSCSLHAPQLTTRAAVSASHTRSAARSQCHQPADTAVRPPTTAPVPPQSSRRPSRP